MSSKTAASKNISQMLGSISIQAKMKFPEQVFLAFTFTGKGNVLEPFMEVAKMFFLNVSFGRIGKTLTSTGHREVQQFIV